MERTYNVKATFKGGKLDKLETGNFGPAVGPFPESVKPYRITVDTVLVWPADPELSGPLSVATYGLGDPPCTNRFCEAGGYKEFNV